jgi:DNA-binding transcriptional MerR regulator
MKNNMFFAIGKGNLLFYIPRKNEAGNRMYTSKDLAIVKELKRLIRTERKTIQEARIAFLDQFPDGIIDSSSKKAVKAQDNQDYASCNPN